MSYVQVGSCPQCGAPVYSPGVWMATTPPPSYRSCMCGGGQVSTILANGTATLPEEVRRIKEKVLREVPTPIISDGVPPAISVNAQGQIIFDENTPGMLDEHIRRIVHEELATQKTKLFKEFEQELTKRIRLYSGVGGIA